MTRTPDATLRIAIVLTQDRGGPVDVAVALAQWLKTQPGVEVAYFGPRPAKDPEAVADVLREQVVAAKSDARAGRRMRHAIREFRPDVVHAQDRRSGLVCAPLTLGRRGLVVLGTYHGTPDGVDERWMRSPRGPRPEPYTRAVLAADALVARRLTRTITVAAPMREFLVRRLRVPARRALHIDNGMPLGPPPTDFEAAPPDSLLFVGLFVPRKGLDLLLHALRQVPEEVRLQIAGDGDIRPQMQALADRLGVGDRVDFLGFRSDIAELMRAAQVFVLPSRQEQQPLVLIAALGAGLVPVGTDVGGVADMLREAPGAFVVPSDDVDQLAQAISTAFRLRRSRPEVAAQNAVYARDRYDISVCGRRHLDLYRELVTQGHRV